MVYPISQLLIITFSKKGNLQLCQNYRIIRLISHSSKVKLKIILNRLKLQVKEIIAEELLRVLIKQFLIQRVYVFGLAWVYNGEEPKKW